ncbi:MAG: DUF4352 domain-containing protein [Pseudomonadota bacterium]
MAASTVFNPTVKETPMKYAMILAALPLALTTSACDGGGSSTNTAAGTSVVAPPIALNKVAKAEGLEFAITRIDQRGQIGIAAAGMKAAAGETYVVARYTIKNVGTAPLTFTERPALSLVDAKGQSYPDDVSTSMMASNGLEEMTGMTSDLNPNVSGKGVAVWKVDKAAFDKVTWRLVLSSSPQLTFALK